MDYQQLTSEDQQRIVADRLRQAEAQHYDLLLYLKVADANGGPPDNQAADMIAQTLAEIELLRGILHPDPPVPSQVPATRPGTKRRATKKE